MMRVEIPQDLSDLIHEKDVDPRAFVLICVAYGLQVVQPGKQQDYQRKRLAALKLRRLNGEDVGLEMSAVTAELASLKHKAGAAAHIQAGVRSMAECMNAIRLGVEDGIISNETRRKLWKNFRDQFEGA